MVDSGFGFLVRRFRHTAWLTQEELAERSGLSPRTIQAIERGQVNRPHRESVRLLADALGLDGAARAEFVAAARQPAEKAAGRTAQPCPTLADCLVRRMRRPGVRGVDLRGLGHTADPAVVLARLLRALGADRRDPGGYEGGMAGSVVPNHTLSAQALPGA